MKPKTLLFIRVVVLLVTSLIGGEGIRCGQADERDLLKFVQQLSFATVFSNHGNVWAKDEAVTVSVSKAAILSVESTVRLKLRL